MNLAAEKKMELVSGFLADFGRYYELVNVRAHADFIRSRESLPTKNVNLEKSGTSEKSEETWAAVE
jgi:hypothetical protein